MRNEAGVSDAGIAVAIMAGGMSRRMGRDKGEIRIDGIPMLERVARAALDAGLPAIVIGRERPEWWRLEAVRFIPDAMPGAGPLGGILTALRSTDGPVLALACDMPMMTAEGIRWLVAIWKSDRNQENVGVISVHGDRIEPLFAIYEHASRHLIEEMIRRGELALKDLARAGSFSFIPLGEIQRGWLNNVNTPEDLARLHEIFPIDPNL